MLLKVGITGCGRVATSIRLPSLQRIKGVKVVAAVMFNSVLLRETVENIILMRERPPTKPAHT